MSQQALEKFNASALAGIIGSENLATINDPFAGGISSGDWLPQISIRGNRLRLKMDGEETVLRDNFIEVYLVTSRSGVSKTFYRDGYSAGAEAKAPDCSSADGIYPDQNIETPENSNCQTCGNNAWGSKITSTGKKGKACSDYKLIVLALTAAPEKPFALRIPAASLKPFGAYIQKLNLAGVPANAAKTKISLGDTEFPSLLFDFNGTVDTREVFLQVDALKEASDVLNAVKIQPRANTAPSEPVTHTAQQPVVVMPVADPTPEPAPEPSEPSLSDLLGAKPKATRKKKEEAPAPEPVVPAEIPAEIPATEEAGGEITSLDALLAKLKK